MPTPAEINAVESRARCLLAAQEVEGILADMAARISANLKADNPLVLCIMNGGLVVSGKLLPQLQFPLQLDYLHATRYRDKTSGSELQWLKKPQMSLKGRSVLLIDDILDEGETLAQVKNYCEQKGAAKISIAVLINKIHDRKSTAIKADYVGVEVEDFYLYGYGMDYKGYLRNAAGIFAVADEDIR